MSSQSSNRVVFLTALAWAGSLFVVSFGMRLVINDINLASNYWLDLRKTPAKVCRSRIYRSP